MAKLKIVKKTFRLAKRHQSLVIVVVIVIVGVLGVYFLRGSKAAAPYGSAETETGTLSGVATKLTDPNASGGSYVQFGPPPSTGCGTSCGGSGVPLLGLWINGTVGASDLGVTQQIVEDYAFGSNYNSYSVPSVSSGQTIMLGVGNVSASDATSIATNLKNAGQGNALIRPMWEMNQGSWFSPWNENALSASAYQSEWINNIYKPMKAVSSGFKFIWNPNGDDGNNVGGRSTYDTYPGDAYVDYIGSDTYDHYGGSLDGNATAMDAFAKQHGKPYVVPEWGLNGSDDTTFMNNMINFVKNPANNVYLQCYFSYPSGTDSDITQFPNSKALYEAAFKGE